MKGHWTKDYPTKPGWYKFAYTTHDQFSWDRVQRIKFVQIVKDPKIKGALLDKTLKGLRCVYKESYIPLGSLTGMWLDCYWWSEPERLPKVPGDTHVEKAS